MRTWNSLHTTGPNELEVSMRQKEGEKKNRLGQVNVTTKLLHQPLKRCSTWLLQCCITKIAIKYIPYPFCFEILKSWDYKN